MHKFKVGDIVRFIPKEGEVYYPTCYVGAKVKITRKLSRFLHPEGKYCYIVEVDARLCGGKGIDTFAPEEDDLQMENNLLKYKIKIL